MGLWEEIQGKSAQRRQANKVADNSNSNLYQYLMADSTLKNNNNNADSSTSSIATGDTIKNIGGLVKNVGSMLGGSSSSSSSVPSQYQFGNLGKTLFGDYDLGGANAGIGSFGSNAPKFDGFGSLGTAGADSGSFLGKVAPYAGILSGAMSAGSEAIQGGSWKDDVPQAFFGVDSEKDSDVMQALKGAGKGATMGMAFGPIGAVVGGVLGLGSSFLDDI